MPDADVVAGTGHRHGITLGSWPTGAPPDGRFFRDVASAVERSGFEMLFAGDHIFTHSSLMESLTLLSHLAAVTEHVTLGTGVLLVPLRDPSVLAKQVATIDVLCGGRFVFGAGVGGEMELEWRALGIDVSTRGRRIDEYLAIMKLLWADGVVEYDGAFRQVHGVTGTPRPVRAGGPPIWIGGRSDAALRRAVRYDGWCAYASSPRRIRDSVAKLHEYAGGELPPGFRVSVALFTLVADTREAAMQRAAESLAGRYRQDFSQIVGSIAAVGAADDIRERVQEYRDAGVDDLLFGPQVAADEYLEQIQLLSETLPLGDA